jgi:segregation and condensation protein B
MGLVSLDDLPPLAPHLPEVSELEAELAALATPVVEVVPDADPETGSHTNTVPDGQDEEARA